MIVKNGSWPEIIETDIDAVTKQLLSGQLSSAGKIDIINSLENKFKDLSNCQYAIAMNSGTTAFHSALFAVGIKSGDEIIVPAYTYHAVAAPIIAMNAVPKFADIDNTYGIVDVKSIEKCLSDKTKAIVVVHNYGYPVDMDGIIKLSKDRGLILIEDCSHAHGAEYKGKPVGGLSDVAFFSLNAAKLVPAGEGGILVTNNKKIYEKALLLGHHFDRNQYDVDDSYLKQFITTGLGLKYRINPLGAALANSQFDRLFNFIERKKSIYYYIAERLCELKNIKCIFPKEFMTKCTFYS